MIAIIRRGSATPDALRMCTCSGFPPASRRKRIFERSDWNEPQFDADETSSHSFAAGPQASTSKPRIAVKPRSPAQRSVTRTGSSSFSSTSTARAHLIPRIAGELARLALYQGALDDAAQHAAAAHAAAVEHECRRCGAGIAATLIEVACANGDLTVADARRTEGLEHAFRLGLSVASAEIRAASARLLAAHGDVAGARNECIEALAVFEESGPTYLAERTRRRIAELDVEGKTQTA